MSSFELRNLLCKASIELSDRESSSLCSRKLLSKSAIVRVRSCNPSLKLSSSLRCSSKRLLKESISLCETLRSSAVGGRVVTNAQKSRAAQQQTREHRGPHAQRDDDSALRHLIATSAVLNSIAVAPQCKRKLRPAAPSGRVQGLRVQPTGSRALTQGCSFPMLDAAMAHPMGSFLRRARRDRLLRRYPVSEELWQKGVADHPILSGLPAEELARLRAFSTVFLREKQFEPPPGSALSDATKLSIALQACLPVLSLGYDWIGDFGSVIVHPDEFVQRRHDLDSAGVMHEWDDPITGEAHPFGPILLSIADVEASGWGDGYNVVIHEIAHKLDMRAGGVADGCPPLHREMDYAVWQQVFTTAFEDFRARPRRKPGGRRSPIDRYAAENDSEFFAVLSEYFFEQPGVVLREYREVYLQLKAFYRQDPAARLRKGETRFARPARD